MKINCFYFGKFSYTIVPWQIKEDLRRIKDNGVEILTINVIEQDYKAAKENIQLVMEETRKQGLKIYFIPERWLGVFGGVHRFPSVFATKNLKRTIQSANTNPLITETGPVCSLFDEKNIKFLKKKLKECFKDFGFDGILWYKPELLLDSKGGSGGKDIISKAYTKVFNDLNQYIKSEYQHPKIGWIQSETSPIKIDTTILTHLDFTNENISILDHRNYNAIQTKSLNSEIETLLSKKPKMLCYFDYPTNVEQPKDSMKIIESYLAKA